jgi:hypothetical protein
MFKLSVHQFLYRGMAALLVFVFLLGAAGVQVAQAASLTVTNLDDSGPGSLRQAVADAQPGDTITFDPALAGGTISVIQTAINIDKDLTILGPGANQLAISGSQSFGVFEVSSYSAPGIGVVTATIQGLTIRDTNYGHSAIHLSSESVLTVNNSTFSNNSGDGIDNYIGTLTVNNSTFNNNATGISNNGTATVNNSIFHGNASLGFGGGISNDNQLTVNDSTFSNNSADYGGAIYNSWQLTVNNSTFSDNSASHGGGIYNDLYTQLTVNNSTFSNNAGRGIENRSGTVNIKNTLLVNSSSGQNCFNDPTYGISFHLAGVNFADDNTCPGLTQVTTAQLSLGSLADNGGPTQTMALLPGSVAIDAATDCTDYDSTPLTTDQRGVARPQGSACDVGAFELEPQVSFNFSGFFQPVDNLPTLNTVNAGKAIPVKFRLGGNQGLEILAAGYPMSQQIACASNAPLDAIEQTVAAGGSSLSYDPATDTYTYIWKTDSSWKNTCRQLIVKLSDGTEHRASFKFK